jgi:cell shape-determining protein MreC
MRGSADQRAARSDVLLFIGCVALALLALALPRSWTYSFAAAIRQSALRPIITLQARASRDRVSRFQLARVERSRDSLALLVQQQFELRRDNDNLRALAGVRARQLQPVVAAEVLHRPTITDNRMLLLDVGSSDGVRPFDAVITADGLLGAVVSTSAHSSSAMTWEHPDFAASAVTDDGRIFGFVHASRAPAGRVPTLELHGLALRDSLGNGAVVMTAGAGGTYPHGIPIGKVTGVGHDVNGYDRGYTLIPFANPGDASHVIVLIGARDTVARAPATRITP